MVSFGRTDQQTTVLALADSTVWADGDLHSFPGELKDLAGGVLRLSPLDPQPTGR